MSFNLCLQVSQKLLTGQFNDDIKQIFQSIADGSDFEIE